MTKDELLKMTKEELLKMAKDYSCDSYNSYNSCDYCDYCYSCSSLKDKNHCAFNVQLTKEEYENLMLKIKGE